MPHFFFDITDGATAIDDEGSEFPNAQAAGDAAVKTLPQMACHETGPPRSRMITVLMRDEVGRHLFTASLNLSSRWLIATA